MTALGRLLRLLDQACDELTAADRTVGRIEAVLADAQRPWGLARLRSMPPPGLSARR
jgi:hypothetical protein